MTKNSPPAKSSNGPEPAAIEDRPSSEEVVGKRIREIRTHRGLSLRELSERSGLNINTLSLVENARSSPSVSTLQQLSRALEVPITAFFESEPVQKRVVYTPAEARPQANFGTTRMENLGKDMAGNAVQPFVVTLEPGAGSGSQMIVHTGYEFVYCLSGKIRYRIEGVEYILSPGDSIVFESHLSHCWENPGSENSQMILTLFPADQREAPGGRHFPSTTPPEVP